MGHVNASPTTSTRSESPLFSLLTLRRTRGLVRGRRGRAVAVSIAVLYGFVALFAGYMLQFGSTGSSGTTVELLTNPHSPAWWNYPALLVIAPGGLLALPVLAAVSMVLVSVGVGLGMGAGILLATRFFRSWKSARAEGGATSTLAGLTPAMVALLTLGACCSTSAAAVGGIGALAEASGTSYDQILLNPWFLNVFQVTVLGIALLAQEQLIAVYGNLVGSPPVIAPRATVSATVEPLRARWPALTLRMFLVIAGTLWALALLIEVASPTPGAPLAAFVLGALWQHAFLGGIAIAAGLVPAILWGVRSQGRFHGLVSVGRALLFAGAVSVVVGAPPPLSTWGIYGLGNEILGAVGVPGNLGGVVAPGGSGVVVDLAFSALYAALGCLTMFLALRPGQLLRRLAVREERAVGLREESLHLPSTSAKSIPGCGAGALDDPV